MEKKKGLTDNGEGEFILNESGTSVSVDADNDNNLNESNRTKTSDEKKGSSGAEEKDFTD